MAMDPQSWNGPLNPQTSTQQNICGIMSKKKLGEYEEPPSGVHELWDWFQEWEKIEPPVCQNLIESMPRRIEAVLKAKGGYTKY